MKHKLTPEDLTETNGFELLAEVNYSDLKAFIINEIREKSVLIKIYSFVQLLAVMVIGYLVGSVAIAFFNNRANSSEFWWMISALVFSISLLIIVHELFHALAFIALGKRDIGFGAQWKKFLFYAEANRQVLDRREITIVALTPLLLITLLCIAVLPYSIGKPFTIFPMSVLLIHLLFCAGDLAIVSFFIRNKKREIYTYDDRLLKRSFFFVRKEVRA